ncbi:hypothetical protein SUGI_1175170 [Cryptomeria japonica]|nr:hypothetical protein SUGI_1175170 [Cryptomeria japonica]
MQLDIATPSHVFAAFHAFISCHSTALPANNCRAYGSASPEIRVNIIVKSDEIKTGEKTKKTISNFSRQNQI